MQVNMKYHSLIHTHTVNIECELATMFTLHLIQY